MTKEELAAKLTGAEYGKEITKELEAEAKAAGLVVVFGYSDDLVEFRGVIHDEVGACGNSAITVDAQGPIPSWEQVEGGTKKEMRAYFKREGGGVAIKALWDPGDGYSWRHETTIPHATFEVVEDGEPYCRGIVFALADVPVSP